jgi:hypothetical protein
MTGKPIQRFKLTQQNGYFAHLHDCVLLSKAAAEKNVEPYFFLWGPMHAQQGLSQSYLSYYFTHRALSPALERACYRSVVNGEAFIEIRDRYDINRYWRGDPEAEISNTVSTIDEGRALFDAHLALRPWLTSICDRFWAKNFQDQRVLSVHYRGTDKAGLEADRVEFAHMLEVIERRFDGQHDAIFLATDDLGFFQFIRASRLSRHLRWFHAPIEQKPLWLPSPRNFRKGAVAIIDCLLLSRGAVLIKTPSLLSSWCKVFNPALELELVGRPYERPYGEAGLVGRGYWPEKCLWAGEGRA